MLIDLPGLRSAWHHVGGQFGHQTTSPRLACRFAVPAIDGQALPRDNTTVGLALDRQACRQPRDYGVSDGSGESKKAGPGKPGMGSVPVVQHHVLLSPSASSLNRSGEGMFHF